MRETRYMISDASKKVEVEAHVLRYWEEELGLMIPRNELGHRYYREEDVALLVSIRKLKEKGFQLKAIRLLLPDINKVEALELEQLYSLRDKLDVVLGIERESGEEQQEGIAQKDNKKVIDMTERFPGEKEEALENEGALENEETLENERTLEMKRTSENERILETKRVSENERTLETKKASKNEEALEMKRISENKRASENERTLEAKKTLENEKALEREIELEKEILLEKEKTLERKKLLAKEKMLKAALEKEELLKNQELESIQENTRADIQLRKVNSEVKDMCIAEQVRQDKLLEFRSIMYRIMSEAIKQNNETLIQDLDQVVANSMRREMDYFLKLKEEREEERFKQLDRTLREYQQTRQQAAAAREFEEKKPRKKSKFFQKNNVRI